MIVGYDPLRVATLARKCREALSSLSTITSHDPDAANATHAVRSLHRTIESGVLAAADDIIRSTPLTRSFGARAPVGAGIRRRRRDADTYESPTSSGTVADLFHDLALARLAAHLGLVDMTNDELFVFSAQPLTEVEAWSGMPDLEDPRQNLINRALAREFERRVDVDPSFAGLVIEWTERNPMIGLVASYGRWPPDVHLDILEATVVLEPTTAASDFVRTHVVERMLPRLVHSSAVALDAVSRPELMTALILQHDWLDLDTSAITDVIDMAFADHTIYDLDARGDDAAAVLASIAQIMNSPAGERGLPDSIGFAVTAGLIPLLPHIVAGFDGQEDFFLTRNDGTVIPTKFASTEDTVTDLFGGLIRTPESLELFLATIPILASAVGHDDGRAPLYTPEEFVGFAVTFAGAVPNENREEQISAHRQRERWTVAVDLLSDVIDVTGVVPVQVAQVGVGLADWLVETSIRADGLRLDDVPGVVETLIAFGIAARIATLWPRDSDDESLDEPLDDLDDVIGSVRERLEAGTDHAEIEAGLAEVRNAVEYLFEREVGLSTPERRRMRRLLDAMDHDALTQPPFQSERLTDLDE